MGYNRVQLHPAFGWWGLYNFPSKTPSIEWSKHFLNILKVDFSVAQTDIFDKLQIIKHFHISLKMWRVFSPLRKDTGKLSVPSISKEFLALGHVCHCPSGMHMNGTSTCSEDHPCDKWGTCSQSCKRVFQNRSPRKHHKCFCHEDYYLEQVKFWLLIK